MQMLVMRRLITTNVICPPEKEEAAVVGCLF